MREVRPVKRCRVHPQPTHVKSKCHGQQHRRAQQPRHPLRHRLFRPEHRIKQRQQRRRHQKRHADVQRRMHAEIHPRKRHQHDQRDAHAAHPLPLCPQCHRAERADGILRVPGRKRIARRGRAGGLHDRKIGIKHPRPRNAARDLQPLVANRAEQADQKRIISRPFVHAPEECERRHHKRDLVAAVGDAGEKHIQRRNPDRFQQTQKFHRSALLF